jgi:glycerol uptake facilitator-like aquaporin
MGTDSYYRPVHRVELRKAPDIGPAVVELHQGPVEDERPVDWQFVFVVLLASVAGGWCAGSLWWLMQYYG